MNRIFKQAVGIDISKDKFDVCFAIIDSNQKVSYKSTRNFTNSNKGFQDFFQWVKKWNVKEIPLVVVMEATGVYYEQLAWYLYQEQQYLSIILPNKARKYAESLGLKSKNDSIDAKGLARMACEQALERWHPLSEDYYTLRTLTRELEDLNNAKTALSNQLHALHFARVKSKSSIKRIEQHVALIEMQITSIKKEVKELVNLNSEMKAKIDRINKVKGLGLMSIVTVVAEANGFALIKNQKQLVSYAGYDVIENQSGKKAGKTRISKKGNSHIRRILCMPAFNVIIHKEPQFVAFYERLIANGKTKMQAYVAIQKKLLVLIYTLWKNDEEYKRKGEIQSTFSDKEPKHLSGVGFDRILKKEVASQKEATQDELPCNKSSEALSGVRQI